MLKTSSEYHLRSFGFIQPGKIFQIGLAFKHRNLEKGDMITVLSDPYYDALYVHFLAITKNGPKMFSFGIGSYGYQYPERVFKELNNDNIDR
jgi:hypothetical protein